MIPEIRNHSYRQRFKDLKDISIEHRKLRGKIEVFKYLKGSLSHQEGVFDSDFNTRTRNNAKKLIVERFNTSIAKHYYPIEITTWSALPSDIVSNRTVNMCTIKNRFYQHWQLNPPNVSTIF